VLLGSLSKSIHFISECFVFNPVGQATRLCCYMCFVYLYGPMSGEYFGRLIATGEWGVCLLSSCKVRYPKNKTLFKKSFKVKVLS